MSMNVRDLREALEDFSDEDTVLHAVIRHGGKSVILTDADADADDEDEADDEEYDSDYDDDDDEEEEDIGPDWPDEET